MYSMQASLVSEVNFGQLPPVHIIIHVDEKSLSFEIQCVRHNILFYQYIYFYLEELL